MIGQLCLLLRTFREAFPRLATFPWFIVAIFGFIVRLDRHGVSASSCLLRLLPFTHKGFLAFFRSGALTLDEIVTQLLKIVVKQGAGRTSARVFNLINDWIKITKETKFMPASKNCTRTLRIPVKHHKFSDIILGC